MRLHKRVIYTSWVSHVRRSGTDTCQKLRIKSLKGTNLSEARASFNPYKITISSNVYDWLKKTPIADFHMTSLKFKLQNY